MCVCVLVALPDGLYKFCLGDCQRKLNIESTHSVPWQYHHGHCCGCWWCTCGFQGFQLSDKLVSSDVLNSYKLFCYLAPEPVTVEDFLSFSRRQYSCHRYDSAV